MLVDCKYVVDSVSVLQGVVYVVDSGFSKQKCYNPVLYISIFMTNSSLFLLNLTLILNLPVIDIGLLSVPFP
jgi:DMSO/TMAO reductase YedYZ heme-binding membrane subunit